MSQLSRTVQRFLGGAHRPADGAPWLRPDVISFLEGVLLNRLDTKVLEFGAGGSTSWFAERAGHVVSFEHDAEWFEKVQAKIDGRPNVDLRLLPRPYSEQVADFPDESFDVVFVDGRDRVRCALAALRTLKPGGIMIVDNIYRQYYAPIGEAMASWRRFDFPHVLPQTSAWLKPAS